MKTISIILPTRGRPEGMHTFINSAFDNCDNKDNVELFIRIDSDDVDSIEYCKTRLRKDIDVKVVIGSRGKGYFSIHTFMDELWPLAEGSLLALMSDDITCETKGWDTLIAPYAEDNYIILWPDHRHEGGGVTPIIHKHLIELAGTVGQWTDVYWENVSKAVSQGPTKQGLIVRLNKAEGPHVIFRHARIYPPSWKDEFETWPGNHYPQAFNDSVSETARKISAKFRGHSPENYRPPPSPSVNNFDIKMPPCIG